jgi:SNF family Na+-dependent transporter
MLTVLHVLYHLHVFGAFTSAVSLAQMIIAYLQDVKDADRDCHRILAEVIVLNMFFLLGSLPLLHKRSENCEKLRAVSDALRQD